MLECDRILGEGANCCRMSGWDDDDWVGEPPEGHYSRDRARPDFWRRSWPLAGAGTALLILIVVIVLVLK
jgi:hypothetical protein